MELHNPFSYLAYGFGWRAFLSVFLAGILCSLLGTYIVLRRMAFIGAGLSHIAFAGIAFGLLIGSSPLLWAFVFSSAASTVLWYFDEKKGLHLDISIGVLFATSMGLAVIFLSLSGNYGSEALSYLFGSPLTSSTQDVLLLFFTLCISSLFFWFFWREIYLITFSRDIAKASGYKTERITFLLSLLISLVVTLSIKAVGAVLVFSLLVVPSAAALKVAKNYEQFFRFSLLFGAISAFIGIFLSFLLDVPSGAAITVSSFFVFLFSILK